MIIPAQIEADLATLRSALETERDGSEFRFVIHRNEIVAVGERLQAALTELLSLMEETAEEAEGEPK